jgi:hypothetical protein
LLTFWSAECSCFNNAERVFQSCTVHSDQKIVTIALSRQRSYSLLSKRLAIPSGWQMRKRAQLATPVPLARRSRQNLPVPLGLFRRKSLKSQRSTLPPKNFPWEDTPGRSPDSRHVGVIGARLIALQLYFPERMRSTGISFARLAALRPSQEYCIVPSGN